MRRLLLTLGMGVLPSHGRLMDCPLSCREHEVLIHAIRGLTQTQTAGMLGVSVSTVRTLRMTALRRLGVVTVTHAALVMLGEGWVSRDQLLPSYEGRPYVTLASKRMSTTLRWLPSPAQRLYIDAFDKLLTRRDDAAAQRVAFAFLALYHEAKVPRPPARSRDVGQMLLSMARGLTRPIPADKA